MAEEQMIILEMLHSGKISPEQAARLLQALQASRDQHSLRIRINIPANLVGHAVRFLTE